MARRMMAYPLRSLVRSRPGGAFAPTHGRAACEGPFLRPFGATALKSELRFKSLKAVPPTPTFFHLSPTAPATDEIVSLSVRVGDLGLPPPHLAKLRRLVGENCWREDGETSATLTLTTSQMATRLENKHVLEGMLEKILAEAQRTDKDDETHPPS